MTDVRCLPIFLAFEIVRRNGGSISGQGVSFATSLFSFVERLSSLVSLTEVFYFLH